MQLSPFIGCNLGLDAAGNVAIISYFNSHSQNTELFVTASRNLKNVDNTIYSFVDFDIYMTNIG